MCEIIGGVVDENVVCQRCGTSINFDGDRGLEFGCIVTGVKDKIEINRHKL
ncbi:MAG: hypothetical protein LBC74_02215 [Planctomycetaceae bacterium]|nr:hypothetical protein [Planctomycetaceae bacterium]